MDGKQADVVAVAAPTFLLFIHHFATSHTQSVDGKQGDVSVEVPNPARDEGKARAEAAKKASILRILPC